MRVSYWFCQLAASRCLQVPDLRSSYRFWRRLADGQRMVHGAARDLLLPEPGSEEMGFLARRMGYEAPSGQDAAAALLTNVERHRERTLAIFNRLFMDEA